jgi:hypothetical protein
MIINDFTNPKDIKIILEYEKVENMIKHNTIDPNKILLVNAIHMYLL